MEPVLLVPNAKINNFCARGSSGTSQRTSPPQMYLDHSYFSNTYVPLFSLHSFVKSNFLTGTYVTKDGLG